MYSRYSERFRLEIIQVGVVGFERQCNVADNGGTPVHRPRSYNMEERARKKLLTKTAWYRPYNAVGFFPGSTFLNSTKYCWKVLLPAQIASRGLLYQLGVSEHK